MLVLSCRGSTDFQSLSVQELHLLDAGCGTGNYSKALIELGVGKVTLMDANEGMLGVAKEKLRNEMEKGKIEHTVDAKVPPLPFKDGSFDVVFFSVVSVCEPFCKKSYKKIRYAYIQEFTIKIYCFLPKESNEVRQ